MPIHNASLYSTSEEYDEYTQMVMDMHKRKGSYTVGFSDWEKDFLDSMKVRVTLGNTLTPAMLDKLDTLWEKL